MSKEFQEKVLKKLEQLDTLSMQVENLSEELKEFKTEQRKFNAKQEQFNAKQEQFNAKQEQFNAKQEEINKKILKRLDAIERNIVIIEDKVSNEIPALFDADKTRYQKQKEFETELDTLDERTEEHSIRILALEDISKKHEEKLKNLVS